MRIHRYIAFGAVAVAALVLLAQPVQAACADAPVIQTNDDDSGLRTFIWTEGYFTPSYYAGAEPFSTGGPSISVNFDAVWWEMGREAANSGTNLWPNWIFPRQADYGGTTYYYGSQLFGTWGQGGVADCVLDNACTCIFMTDVVNNVGYWAVTGNNNVPPVRKTTLTQLAVTDPAGNAGPIILKPIPEAFIVDTSRAGSDIVVTVNSSPEPGSEADYQLGTCDCVAGYRVMSLVSELPPTDRDAAAWTEVPGQPASGTPLGTPVDVSLTCGGTENIWLAIQVAGGEVIETSVVSGNSTRVECDPTLVDDQPLQPRQPRGDRRQGLQGR